MNPNLPCCWQLFMHCNRLVEVPACNEPAVFDGRYTLYCATHVETRKAV